MIISATMAEASATAEGELARTPLAHLLVYALDRRLTGAMFLAAPTGPDHVIRLVRGVPVKVRPGDRFALLGEMLVEAGAIDAPTVQAALATQGLLGDVLLLAGRIERDVLERVAEAQFVRRLVRLFGLPPSTGYRYYEGHDELAEYGGDPCCLDPLALIWAGLRAHGEASTMIDSTLARLGDSALRLHPATSVARFGLEAVEASMVDALSASPLTLGELGAAFPPDVVRRFVYALTITRQLELGTGHVPLGADAPPSARGHAPAPAPPASTPSSVPPTQPAAQTAVARLALKSTVHRLGAAAPDSPGDGERGTVSVSRRSRERRAPEVTTDDAPISSVEPVPPSSGPPSSGVVAVPSSPPTSTEEPAISNAATTLRSGPPPAMGRAEGPPNTPPVTMGGAEGPPQTPLSASLGAEGGLVEEEAFAGVSVEELFWLASEMVTDHDPAGAVEACTAGLRRSPGDPDSGGLERVGAGPARRRRSQGAHGAARRGRRGPRGARRGALLPRHAPAAPR